MSVLEKIDKFLSEVTETAPDEEKWLTQKERSKHPYALKVAMIKKRKKKGKKVNEATVEFYTYAPGKPSDILQVKDVPALLRAVGMGTKKISLESEGNRQALNKALKSGKYIYAAFNPFMEEIAGKNEILWHTDKKKFVKTYSDLGKEV